MNEHIYQWVVDLQINSLQAKVDAIKSLQKIHENNEYLELKLAITLIQLDKLRILYRS